MLGRHAAPRKCDISRGCPNVRSYELPRAVSRTHSKMEVGERPFFETGALAQSLLRSRHPLDPLAFAPAISSFFFWGHGFCIIISHIKTIWSRWRGNRSNAWPAMRRPARQRLVGGSTPLTSEERFARCKNTRRQNRKRWLKCSEACTRLFRAAGTVRVSGAQTS